ncbi:MAG TPA: hypothetical protein VIJ68_00410 [Candidatus Saccharimonadales bacterium]
MAKKTGKTTAKRKPSKSARKKAATAKPAAVRTKRATLTAPKSRRPKQPAELPNAWRITKTAALMLWQYRRLFIGITLVYGLLNIMLVQGLASSTNVGDLKSQLSHAFTGHLGSLASSLSIFAVLVGGAGNSSSQTSGAYQLFLGLLASLAVIWALRQVLSGAQPRIRDAYYRGMFPLVPFTLVLLVIGLQLLPLLAGSLLYSVVITNGIAVHFAEKFFWALLYGALAILSLYMISGSVFALYIATLPDMTPVKALRSAKELVRGRRWSVLRKILSLPVILLLVPAIVMVPIIIWLTPLTRWVFFLLTISALTAVHAYLYTLYRELLNDNE